MNTGTPIAPGDVFLYENYQFLNGTTRDKLFIVLNDYVNDGSSTCLALITTSQKSYYRTVIAGCNRPETVYVVPKGWDTLLLDTFIPMRPIYLFSFGELIKLNMLNVVEKKTHISDRQLGDLLTCLEQFAYYIPIKARKILFPHLAPFTVPVVLPGPTGQAPTPPPAPS